MKQDLLQYLACPECGEGLACEALAAGAELREGLLACRGCGALYPVIDSIPRLLNSDDLPSLVTGYGAFLESAGADIRGKLPEGEPPSRGRGDERKIFRGVGGRDYHETRQEISTVRYSLSRRIEAISDALARFEGREIGALLEVGCADGMLSQSLSRRYSVSTVVGMDLQDEGFRHNPYPVLQADCEKMPFKAGGFDAVVAGAVIEHLREPQRFLEGAYRVLRDGGVIALTCPDPKYDWLCTVTGYFRHAGHIHRFSIEDVRRMLADAGWSDTGGWKFMLSPWPVRLLGRMENGALRAVLAPLMMNQVIYGVK